MVTIQKHKFSKLQTGEIVHLFRFDNGTVTVDIIDLGAAIVAINTPDQNGKVADICLGFSNGEDYLNQAEYFGVVAGRYANRIAKGKFTLNGQEYTLTKNDGENHLHGGNIGFGKKIWDFEITQEKQNPILKLTLESSHLEEGYPGNLKVQVTYSLDEQNRLTMRYTGVSDQDTILNLTNHTYFNLNGHNKGDVLRHKLYLNADRFARVDETCIPTGELVDVNETPFDFTQSDMHTIGERISEPSIDLENGNGYDHSFMLNSNGKQLIKAATLQEDYTGRQLNVYTNKPAVQLYTGNGLNKQVRGKNNCHYGKRSGVCLETQFMPDSPNQKSFGDCILKANETYDYTTIFEFNLIKLDS